MLIILLYTGDDIALNVGATVHVTSHPSPGGPLFEEDNTLGICYFLVQNHLCNRLGRQ